MSPKRLLEIISNEGGIFVKHYSTPKDIFDKLLPKLEEKVNVCIEEAYENRVVAKVIEKDYCDNRGYGTIAFQLDYCI